MRKSNLITIATAAVIVALAGGTGAYAGSQITGNQIKNGSITAKDLAKNSVKAKQLANNSVTEDQLKDGSVTTEALEPEAEAAVETVTELTDSNAPGTLPGSLIQTWNDEMASDRVVNLPGTYNAMVYLNVQNESDKPVRVSVEGLFCVATPVTVTDAGGTERDLGGQCQASGLMTMGPVWVTGADQEGVTVEVNVVRVD